MFFKYTESTAQLHFVATILFCFLSNIAPLNSLVVLKSSAFVAQKCKLCIHCYCSAPLSIFATPTICTSKMVRFASNIALNCLTHHQLSNKRTSPEFTTRTQLCTWRHLLNIAMVARWHMQHPATGPLLTTGLWLCMWMHAEINLFPMISRLGSIGWEIGGCIVSFAQLGSC